MKELKNLPIVKHNDFTCPFCGSENTSKISSRDKALQSYMLLNSSFTTIGAAALLKQKKFLDKNNVDIVQCNRCAESYFMERKEIPKKEHKQTKVPEIIKFIRNSFLIYCVIMIIGAIIYIISHSY